MCAISIHAPTRGATPLIFRHCDIHIISIHAPTRGATRGFPTLSALSKFQSTLPRGERLRLRITFCHSRRFQSTLPRGERLHGIIFFYKHSQISIHAPTRGATYSDIAGLLLFLDFNPRSHEGSDGLYNFLIRVEKYFNPRSHEGSDRAG